MLRAVCAPRARSVCVPARGCCPACGTVPSPVCGAVHLWTCADGWTWEPENPVSRGRGLPSATLPFLTRTTRFNTDNTRKDLAPSS